MYVSERRGEEHHTTTTEPLTTTNAIDTYFFSDFLGWPFQLDAPQPHIYLCVCVECGGHVELFEPHHGSLSGKRGSDAKT